MLLTRWCSEDLDVCPRQGTPTNDTKAELIQAGWKLREQFSDELERTAQGWEMIEKATEVWTCPACADRLKKAEGVHYTFKRHGGKRRQAREPIRLTIPNQQADNQIARHGAIKGNKQYGFVDV